MQNNTEKTSTKKRKDANNKSVQQVTLKENENLKNTNYKVFNKDQLNILEEAFKGNRFMNKKNRRTIAKLLKVRPNRIKIWFKERRMIGNKNSDFESKNDKQNKIIDLILDDKRSNEFCIRPIDNQYSLPMLPTSDEDPVEANSSQRPVTSNDNKNVSLQSVVPKYKEAFAEVKENIYQNDNYKLQDEASSSVAEIKYKSSAEFSIELYKRYQTYLKPTNTSQKHSPTKDVQLNKVWTEADNNMSKDSVSYNIQIKQLPPGNLSINTDIQKQSCFYSSELQKYLAQNCLSAVPYTEKSTEYNDLAQNPLSIVIDNIQAERESIITHSDNISTISPAIQNRLVQNSQPVVRGNTRAEIKTTIPYRERHFGHFSPELHNNLGHNCRPAVRRNVPIVRESFVPYHEKYNSFGYFSPELQYNLPRFPAVRSRIPSERQSTIAYPARYSYLEYFSPELQYSLAQNWQKGYPMPSYVPTDVYNYYPRPSFVSPEIKPPRERCNRNCGCHNMIFCPRTRLPILQLKGPCTQCVLGNCNFR